MSEASLGLYAALTLPELEAVLAFRHACGEGYYASVELLNDVRPIVGDFVYKDFNGPSPFWPGGPEHDIWGVVTEVKDVFVLTGSGKRYAVCHVVREWSTAYP